MQLLLFIFIIQHVSSAQSNSIDNETLLEIQKLNALEFEHDASVIGLDGTFSFTLKNTSYVRDVLNISSYYISITFIDKDLSEERLAIVDLPSNITTYNGKVIMQHLELEGNYLVCVIFLKENRTGLVASSRFCHVVSVSDSCRLEKIETSFTNQPAYLLIILVVALLIIDVAFSYLRAYIYRPRTVAQILEKLPPNHGEHLQSLAGRRIIERSRHENPALDQHLRTGSIYTIDDETRNNTKKNSNEHAYEKIILDAVAE